MGFTYKKIKKTAYKNNLSWHLMASPAVAYSKGV